MILLPVDVICEWILPHLSVCDLQALDTAFTNKCLRPQLQQVWKSYQYDSFDVIVSDYQVIWLCGVGVQIISLVLCASPKEWIIPIIPTLKKLRLSSKMCSDSLLKMVSTSHKLEELYVNEVYESNIDNDVSVLAQNCRQLHTLDISSDDLTDTAIMVLAQYCTKLHTVRINGSGVTDAGVQALCDNCPHLKHIGLSNCSLTDASLMSIANSYPHLESIHSIGNNNFTDDGFLYIADKCHELRSVSVKRCNITSRGLTALWAANPNLMDVNISYNRFISDDVIIQLAQCCPLLQKLNMCDSRLITDAAVIAVAEHCPQLRSLNISHCYGLSDASLIALGQHSHELKSIYVWYLENVSDVGIAALVAGCPLLQKFNASSTNITDVGVIALARRCRDLRKVDMSWCKYIRIDAVSAIAENCPLISEWNMSYCKIDDACLHVVAQRCRNLTSLNIQKDKVSTNALRAVITSCRMLQTIDCSGCFRKKGDRISMRKCSRRINIVTAWFRLA